MATVDERTQEILALRLGMALIGSARLQAENEALQAAAAVKEHGKSDAPTGAETQGSDA